MACRGFLLPFLADSFQECSQTGAELTGVGLGVISVHSQIGKALLIVDHFLNEVRFHIVGMAGVQNDFDDTVNLKFVNAQFLV